MDCFVDLDIRSDPEFPAHVLLSELYKKLHRTLVISQRTDIAISFPQYASRPPSLGTRFRLLAAQPDLEALMNTNWLGGMRDFASHGALGRVPEHAVARTLRRVQAKSNPARLRRRLMRRHDVTVEQAQVRIPDSAAEFVSLPFVQLSSGSTGQPFRLFLKLGPPQSSHTTGKFNAFGLSLDATIPWF